jgi:hypothetical protein
MQVPFPAIIPVAISNGAPTFIALGKSGRFPLCPDCLTVPYPISLLGPTVWQLTRKPSLFGLAVSNCLVGRSSFRGAIRANFYSDGYFSDFPG